MKLDIEENINMFKKVISEKDLAIESKNEELNNLKKQEPDLISKIDTKK